MTPSGAVDLFLCKKLKYMRRRVAAPKRATRIENKIFREEQIYECIRNCNVQDH